MVAIDTPLPRTSQAPPPAATLVRDPATPEGLRADVWVGLGLFIAAVITTVLSAVTGFFGTDPHGLQWSILFAAVSTLPMIVRRRYPVTVAFIVNAAYIVAGEFGFIEIYVSQVVMFFSIYTVGAWVSDRHKANISRIVIVVAMFLWLLVSTFRGATEPPPEGLEGIPGIMSPTLAFLLLQWLINIAYFSAAYVMGDRAFEGAIARQALRERTRELEEQQEIASAQAVALDRVRIARELHDVVAHHVSTMGVQAGAARAVVDADPDKAKQALAVVEESARGAIGEMRRLLDTLRDGEDSAAEAPSTIGLSSLDALVRGVDAAGTPASLRVIGEPVPVPEFVQINLYRIAQEALTNARRHGGPGAEVDVRLRYSPDAVELEASNTGRVVLASRTGLGTLGMRERATAMGAHLEAGPREHGGYLVRVRVPLDPASTMGS